MKLMFKWFCRECVLNAWDTFHLYWNCFNWIFVLDVTFLPVSKVTGRVEVEDVMAALRPNTCLVSVMLANNETGVIMVSGLR